MPVAEPVATRLHVLHPGDVAVGQQGDRFETLLGSCVAVLLTDPRRTVGAMCHIVHCGRPASAGPGDTAYAPFAMDEMYGLLIGQGIDPRRCLAHVYGGGNMFPGLFSKHHVGASNVDWVLGHLDDEGIEVVSNFTGGAVYRKVAWTVGPFAPAVISVEV